MSDPFFTPQYWQNRWQTGETGWDIGYASPPITTYFEKVDRTAKVLIPGCGNGWEGEYLYKQGFINLTLLDIAPKAIEAMQKRMQDAPMGMIMPGDFFELDDQYDYIIEQTFFCALHPSLRDEYVQKAASLLTDNGKLVGVLFDTDFGFDHPPFGGTKEIYKQHFQQSFEILHLSPCNNSIGPRKGKELFIEARRKEIK